MFGAARRIEHHPGLTEAVDLREDTAEMDRRGRLGLDEEMIGAGVGEAGGITLRLAGSTIIRSTLSGFHVQCHTASATTGPMFGTNRSSVTSTWIQSAPAARRHEPARRAGQNPPTRSTVHDDQPLRRGIRHGGPGALNASYPGPAPPH
ncbi:MAG: hypothetical protein WBW81_09765 [Methylocella sp.]